MENIFSIVPVEACMDKRLNKNHYKVLIAILSFRSKNTDAVWPKRAALAERCGLPETRISTITSELVSLGWLRKEGKGGFSKAVSYRVTVPETVTETVTVTEPVTVTETVTNTVTETVTVNPTTVTETVTPTVTETVTRKEETIEETKEKIKENKQRKSALNFSVMPADLSQHVLDDWLTHRKSIKVPVSTQTVLDVTARELEKARLFGWTPDEALAESITAGWRGVKAEWLNNRRSQAAPTKNRQAALEASNREAIRQAIAARQQREAVE